MKFHGTCREGHKRYPRKGISGVVRNIFGLRNFPVGGWGGKELSENVLNMISAPKGGGYQCSTTEKVSSELSNPGREDTLT